MSMSSEIHKHNFFMYVDSTLDVQTFYPTDVSNCYIVNEQAYTVKYPLKVNIFKKYLIYISLKYFFYTL
jgi:hypothetical protein